MDEKEIVIHRICEECRGLYPQEVEHSLTKIDELNEKVSEGKYTFTETENQLIYRKTWFVCPDCSGSRQMDRAVSDGDEDDQSQSNEDQTLSLEDAVQVLQKHTFRHQRNLEALQRKNKEN